MDGKAYRMKSPKKKNPQISVEEPITMASVLHFTPPDPLGMVQYFPLMGSVALDSGRVDTPPYCLHMYCVSL